MPIHIPTLMEPLPLSLGGTEEQWQAYLDQQEAGIEYALAYGDTIGIFSLFSRKRAKRLNEARQAYHEARDRYLEEVLKNE